MAGKEKRFLILSLLLLFGNFFVWWAVVSATAGELTVAFLDIGQGDAIYIESPAGNQVLIDGGPGKSVLRELGEVMPFFDRSLDLVILTHADSDHVGGLPLVFERYQVSALAESGVGSDNNFYDALLVAATAEPAQKILAARGTQIDLGGGALLEIIFPDQPVSGADPNNASVVAKLIYGQTSFLLTGDAPEAIERYLVKTVGADLDVDVLKAGHHGSDTSTSLELLKATTPEYVVFSVGAENRYGHPKAAVLERTQNVGAQIMRTDERGTIIFKTDGANLRLAI